MEKRKRLLSGFDIALVAVVLLGALAWFFVINRTPQVEGPVFEGSRAIYRIEVMDLTAEQAAAVQVGDRLQEGSRHVPIGEVIAIEIRPNQVRVDHDETQTIRWEDVEDRYVLLLTVETEVQVTERDILAEGQHPLKGGSGLHFTGPGFAFTRATILTIERGA